LSTPSCGVDRLYEAASGPFRAGNWVWKDTDGLFAFQDDTIREHAAREGGLRHAARRGDGPHPQRSRRRTGSIDNFGGSMIVHPYRNTTVAGEPFELTADDVEACLAR
ncbi:MAG TPA: hypothetical protein VF119_10155, partial [Candidatus Limnocylindrales bacterium]